MPERKFVVMEKIDCPACGGTGRIRYIDRLTGARKRTGCEKCDRSGKVLVEVDFREALRCTMNGGEDAAQPRCSAQWNMAGEVQSPPTPENKHSAEESLKTINEAILSLGSYGSNSVRYFCAELLVLLFLTAQ